MTAIPKAKKSRKKTRQNYSAQCDALFGKLVRLPGRCVICGSTDRVQCAHGFSRRYRAIRWDFRNAWPMCAAHHYKYTLNPLEWDDWLLDTWGELLYAEMRALALSGERPDLKKLAESLRARVKETAVE